MRKTRGTQEDVFDHLFSTNQRLIREMEEFLSSVETSSDVQDPLQTSAARPRPHYTSSYVNPEWMQKSHDYGVISERSNCDNEMSDLQEINEGEYAEDHDDFDIRLQKIDDTIDTALNHLQSQSRGRKPAEYEYEYYNDPKYQRQTRERYLDDDSLVAMAKRLDEASIISDPSVICGTSEKFPLITATTQRYKQQGCNHKSAKNDVPGTTSSDPAARNYHFRRSSNISSTSSSSSNSSRDVEVPSSNPTRFRTVEDALKSTPAAKKGTTATFDNKSQSSMPRSHLKVDKKRTYKNGSVDEWSKENCTKPSPSSKATSDKKKSTKEAAHPKGDSNRDSAAGVGGGYAQKIPRACYSDFRNGSSTALHSSQDSGADDGEDSDHTEFFYESTDENSDDEGSDEDEYYPRAVGSSVADAVKDLNNQRPLKRMMNLFGKKSKGEDDMWSVMTQRGVIENKRTRAVIS